MRELDALAVVDSEKRSVVWAAQGSWRGQHAPQFLDSGRLLIFDNIGLPWDSRVLEYDPQTQAFPWVCVSDKNAPFTTLLQGMSQRLPNGNTLIVKFHRRQTPGSDRRQNPGLVLLLRRSRADGAA